MWFLNSFFLSTILKVTLANSQGKAGKDTLAQGSKTNRHGIDRSQVFMALE
jgi:hypothetical protein